MKTGSKDDNSELAVDASSERPSSAHGGQKADPLRRQEAVVALGRRAIASPDVSILLQDAAAMIAEMLDVEYDGVAEVSADGSTLVQRLSITPPGQTQPRMFVQESGTAGEESLAGHALQLGHLVAVSDLSQDGKFQDLFLREHGIQSAVSVPLRIQNQSFGALFACTDQSRLFEAEDILFVEAIAHLVTTTIAREHAEKSLHDERRLASNVLQTVDAIVLVLNGQGNIVRINRACERTTGFSLADLKDRPVWNVLAVPEEVELLREILERIHEDESPVQYESFLLTKHSERRRIAWSYSTMTGSDGAIESIVASGIDITETRQMEEKVQRAEQAAQDAKQVMDRLRSSAEQVGNTPRAVGQAPHAEARDQSSASIDPMGSVINQERRGRPRRSYPYRQRIAPIIGGKLPDPHEFFEVQCNDISAGGFSFLSPAPPNPIPL